MPVWLGWALLAVFVPGYAAIKVTDALGRRRAGFAAGAVHGDRGKVFVLAALGAAFTYEMGINRNLATNAFFSSKSQGMPWAVVLLVGLYAVWHFVLSRTRYGRHVYAVGGNAEAARRAGVAVSRVRISVFVVCSGMAAISGIVAASLLQSVQSNAGAGNTLLLAVGAAVIGGTSLFGGHGRVIDAVLGGLVVAVIINGMSDSSRAPTPPGTNGSSPGGPVAGGRIRRGRPPRLGAAERGRHQNGPETSMVIARSNRATATDDDAALTAELRDGPGRYGG